MICQKIKNILSYPFLWVGALFLVIGMLIKKGPDYLEKTLIKLESNNATLQK